MLAILPVSGRRDALRDQLALVLWMHLLVAVATVGQRGGRNILVSSMLRRPRVTAAAQQPLRARASGNMRSWYVGLWAYMIYDGSHPMAIES